MEERIEDFFEKRLSDSEARAFEKELEGNPELAKSVAFYLLARQAASDEYAERLALRHKEWTARPAPEQEKGKVLRIPQWYYTAAASLLIILGIVSYFLIRNPDNQSMHSYAAEYRQHDLSKISITMSADLDSLKLAVGSYNSGDYAGAGRILDRLLNNDPDNPELLKVAGLNELGRGEFGSAITYFQKLGTHEELFANPGKFYEAVAWISSDLPDGEIKARKLLEEVVEKNLDKKEIAEKWLK